LISQTTDVAATTHSDRAARLKSAVTRMAGELDRGERDLCVTELETLEAICREHFLYVEAARVRRWLGKA
jgi:hypothetical protein